MESEIKNVQIFSSTLYMAPVNGYVYNMHRVPTYAEIIEEAIIHPVDKIQLPDRQALFIRNLNQMTRFDEVDDPANIGDEQERIQEAKLKELTLKQLAPGRTQSIARLTDRQSRPQDTYTPAGGGTLNEPPPPPAPQGILRRAGSAIGNGILGGMIGTLDYMLAPSPPPFQYFQTDYDAGLRAEREISARQEQEDQERMEYYNSWATASSFQAEESLNSPASTANYYIGDQESPTSQGREKSGSGEASSSGGAASSLGGWDRVARARAERLAAERLAPYNQNTGGGVSRGSSAVDASHHAALESMRKKAKSKAVVPQVVPQVGMSAGSSAVDRAHEESIARMGTQRY
jgi:hypothetical protein